MKNKVRGKFAWMRRLAWAAIVCTLALMVFLFVESAMPGDQSARQTGSLSQSIKDRVDVNDNDVTVEVERLVASLPNALYYVGDTAQLQVDLYPNQADAVLTYRSDHPELIGVDERGCLHFYAFGTAQITAEAQGAEGEHLSDSVKLTCIGNRPDTMQAPFSLSQTTFTVGKKAQVTLRGAGGEKVSIAAFTVTRSDPALGSVHNTFFYPAAAGSGTLSLAFGTRAMDVFPITVEPDPAFKVPTQFVYDSQIVLERGETLQYADLVRGVEPAGASAELSVKIQQDERVLTNSDSMRTVRARKTGSATLRVTSRYNPACSATVRVTVVEPVPSALRILGKDRVTLEDGYRYYAFADGDYVEGVTWTVVQGRAQLSEDGHVVPTRLGRLVLRATSTQDPTVWAEMEVTVSLFANFHSFVRKILGHFSLFALLGFGLAAVWFFLLRRRRGWAVGLAGVCGGAAALFSEFLQTPLVTTGRYFTWSDVLIDTTGALTGVVIGLALFGLYCLLRFRLPGWQAAKQARHMLWAGTLCTPLSRLFPPTEPSADAAPESAPEPGREKGDPDLLEGSNLYLGIGLGGENEDLGAENAAPIQASNPTGGKGKRRRRHR